MRFILLSISLFFMLLNESSSQERFDFGDLSYRNLGPTRGGRVTAVCGVNDQPNLFYMGSTGGGVWKSENYGISWENISDGYFSSPSIGEIRVFQADPNIIYVGTGSDGLRSNVISGKGIYKSVDAGKSWQHVGLQESGHIGDMEIHPTNPDIVYVAAIGSAFANNEMRGVFKTTDGGESWKKVLYHSDSIGFAAIALAPDEPNTLYATAWRTERKPWTIISGSTEGGIYKSTDAGETWKKVTTGLPQGLIGKIDLAVTPANPDKVFAIIEAPEESGGFYSSSDRGETWEQLSDRPELTNRPFYYTNVTAHPRNEDVVFSNAMRFMRSDDGGKTWEIRSTPHGDNHDLWINPNDTSIWIQSNDGGANVTQDGGKSWSSQLNQATSELYTVDVDDQYPYYLYAGQQDNSTAIALPSRPPFGVQGGAIAYVINTGGCETGPAVPKPGNHNIVYANCKGRFMVHDKRTGQTRQYYVGAANMYGHNPKDLTYRFQRVAPIHVSPHNPDVVYHTSQYVHKTTNDGQRWETISPDLTAFEPDKQIISGSPITRDVTGEEFYSTIYDIKESVIKEGLIWVGANDGPIHLTNDGGKSWDNVTPTDLPPGGRVDCVEPSPHQEGKAYAAVLRNMLGDETSYLYKTEDFGRTWQHISTPNNGFPENTPVRVVREDPDKEGLLYAGTEYGMYVSFDDGKKWHPFQQNLPITPIADIKVFRKDLVIATMGRGFWIMDDLSALHQVEDWQESKLLTPAASIKYIYRGSRKGEIPEYPAPSASIYYYLQEKPKEVSLEIRNADGELVNAYFNKESSEKSGSRDMRTEFYTYEGKAGLQDKKGLNKFAWDMSHYGAWTNNARAFNYGPMVAPGQYTLVLNVDGVESKESIEILADPDVLSSGISLEDMQAQEELSLKIRALQSDANQFLAEVQRQRITTKNKRQITKLTEIEARLVMADGIYMKPMLTNQISYLYNMLRQADQKPGEDAYERFEELKKQLEELKNQL